MLTRMNEAGVLGKFIPDFGRIVSMMQFNMYHHYTVDEHLIRSVGILAEVDQGQHADIHPLAVKLMPNIEERTVLFVAVLLHDIAKGRQEDHSIAGAKVARRLCPRLGLNDKQTELVVWLIDQHLLMSMVAQTRDLHDRKTITDFAEKVQSLDRLRMLLVLTVCDIRAVGRASGTAGKANCCARSIMKPNCCYRAGFPKARARSAPNRPPSNWLRPCRTGARRTRKPIPSCITNPIC